MKKLLSILAAVGLTATASTSVVACSKTDKTVDNKTNAPSATYSDFEKWVSDTKGTGVTSVIFVGGRTDVDSISWLAAREQYATGKVNYNDVKALTDNGNVKQMDQKFSDRINSPAKDQDSTIKSLVTNSKNWNGQGGDSGKAAFQQGLMTNYFWKDTKDLSSVQLHSIMVDDITKFWNEGIGSTGIIAKFMKDQVTGVNTWKHTDDNQKKPFNGKDDDKTKTAEIDATQKNITSALKDKKGPFFLIINNGKLTGITNGFKNYKVFSKDSSADLNQSGNQDVVDLFKYFRDQVWFQLPEWLNANWTPYADPSKSAGNAAFIKDDSKISGWSGLANTGKTWTDPNASTDDSGTDSKDKDKDDKNKKSDTNSGTNAYVINPENYIK